MRQKHFYLFRVQFLGFRYSGWQKQPGQKTIEGMLLKTLKFILPKRRLKVLGAGRTDAKVSAINAAFELILDGEPLSDEKEFMTLFNSNLPPDIKVLTIKKTDNSFNIIQHSKQKEYHYYFAFGEKIHPFCAPFMANFIADLDIDKMALAARTFEGSHSFHNYTAQKSSNKSYDRTINSCIIEKNQFYHGNFFPDKSYVLKIKSKGFVRYQVRMIMGALLQLGEGKLSIDDIDFSLKVGNDFKIPVVAPGSGLLLNDLDFE